MKWNNKSFGVKLWFYFLIFASLIMAALWMLQTVFLQSFYNGMVIKNVKQVAGEILTLQGSENLDKEIDRLTYDNSLLIYLTDWQGNILYSSDEYLRNYQEWRTFYPDNQDRVLSYQKSGYYGKETEKEPGADNKKERSYRELPKHYDAFLERLNASEDRTVGYQTEDGSTYLYGLVLTGNEAGKDGGAHGSGNQEQILYISAKMGAVGSTVMILQKQLLWVTIGALLFGVVIACFISKKFARPIAALTKQTRLLAEGNYHGPFEAGFCSELDELSQSLKQTSEELRRTENVRRELLANISHDLRTPLTMIRGYTELVRDSSWSDEERRNEDLAIIIRETERLTRLVNDIMEYSSLQSSQQMFRMEEFELAAAIRKVIRQFETLYARKMQYCIEASLDEPCVVRGDERQLERVLYNLLDNAAAYTGEDGRITVTLKINAGLARTEIRDYGKGISQEELPRIWERYFTKKNRGNKVRDSGLGLAIVKEILMAHHVLFGVESRLGEGTVFWFEFHTDS